jgi:hypothetical protein
VGGVPAQDGLVGEVLGDGRLPGAVGPRTTTFPPSARKPNVNSSLIASRSTRFGQFQSSRWTRLSFPWSAIRTATSTAEPSRVAQRDWTSRVCGLSRRTATRGTPSGSRHRDDLITV